MRGITRQSRPTLIHRDTPSRTFAGQLRAAPSVWISPLFLVDGAFDALSIRAACPDLAVAGLPGVARLSSPALTRLNPAGRRVTVLLDADADLHRAARQDPQGPTAAAARALTDQLQAAGAQVWTCPALDGHADLNDALVALGRAAFAQRLRVALERQVRPLNPQRRLC